MIYKIRDKKVGLLIHADNVEDVAMEQIENMVEHPAMKDLIAIMPDVHAGAGSVIGFTGKFNRSIIANIVGVDIGCGVVCYNIGKDKFDFEQLDSDIRATVPMGFKNRDGIKDIIYIHEAGFKKSLEDICEKADEFYTKYQVKLSTIPQNQMGTLGGGNHFIEIDIAEDGTQYLLVHSGSRNFGLKVALYFQRMAKQICSEMGIETPTDLEYLPMSAGGEDYLTWMRVAQEYARLNREAMMRVILGHLDITFVRDKYIESVHNYIAKDNIIRKGAIQAYKGQEVIIPLNMSDGVVLGTGKGNRDYNYSAPHGAGRLFGRKEMKRRLASGDVTMEDFTTSMDGIYSNSVKECTIDECKYAYKDLKDIEKYLKETVIITNVLKPVYSLKSDEDVN